MFQGWSSGFCEYFARLYLLRQNSCRLLSVWTVSFPFFLFFFFDNLTLTSSLRFLLIHDVSKKKCQKIWWTKICLMITNLIRSPRHYGPFFGWRKRVVSHSIILIQPQIYNRKGVIDWHAIRSSSNFRGRFMPAKGTFDNQKERRKISRGSPGTFVWNGLSNLLELILIKNFVGELTWSSRLDTNQIEKKLLAVVWRELWGVLRSGHLKLFDLKSR